MDVNGQRDLVRDANTSRAMPIATASSVATNGTSNNTGILGKSDKIDPYYMIIHVSIIQQVLFIISNAFGRIFSIIFVLRWKPTYPAGILIHIKVQQDLGEKRSYIALSH